MSSEFSLTLFYGLSHHISDFLDTGLLSDIEFIVTLANKRESFKVHKLVLASSSDYFKSLFLGPLKENGLISTLDNIDPHIFRLYIDGLYGKRIVLSDWREAFQLFSYIDYTQTEWINKDKDVVWGFYVPPKDYIEYIVKISNLYDGEIPNKVVYDSAKHITNLVDLSPLSEEFLEILLNSEHILKADKSSLLKHMKLKGVDPSLLDRLRNYQLPLASLNYIIKPCT